MKKGFTLVELLIVLAVIAALLSVATPLALNAVKSAKASQVAQNFKAIKSAVENWFNTETPNDTDISGLTLEKLKDAGYLSNVPGSFSLTAPNSGTNGVYNFTIEYTGGDVEAAKVQKNLPEVSDDLKLKFELQKWW
ncbi:N-terminal cleavage protein [Thermosipho affectus]|uniref:N-terminal cleavage protein n=1 Tax=Thermosipho affectus TaxID=660294 RepID=A0ABX3IHN4_9BACT|nr:prepilin-type N-terminal cleavage/methylation domain-containing protein [Thermosipho affectus]ONN27333.1 N-terminal cleavage protein [Thermosipho affectus]